MARSSHPPAWYPDPDDPARIRRWNGRSWTEDIRPLPDWLRTLRLLPGPPARIPRASRRLWITSAALLLVGALVTAVLATANEDADRIGDGRFVRLANVRCVETETAVVRPNRERRDGAVEARRIDTLAAGWEEMVVDLRKLPLDPADDAKVDRWLRAWDRWTAHGREYADALRAGDETEAKDILRRSREENATMTRFALVNGLNGCLFNSG